MDRGLLQREAAERIGAHTSTIANWEAGRSEPALRHWPGVIRFLGFVPFPPPSALAQELLAYRRLTGTSQEELAAELEVDPSTVWRWEAGHGSPLPDLGDRVRRLIDPAISCVQWL